MFQNDSNTLYVFHSGIITHIKSVTEHHAKNGNTGL